MSDPVGAGTRWTQSRHPSSGEVLYSPAAESDPNALIMSVRELPSASVRTRSITFNDFRLAWRRCPPTILAEDAARFANFASDRSDSDVSIPR